MNRADRVSRIVLAAEQRLGFRRYELVLKPSHQLAQFIERGLIFFCKFKEHAGVGNLSLEFLLPLDRSLSPAAFLQKLLCCFLIGPEVRR